MQLFCNTCQKITFHSELSSSGTTIQYHQCNACGEIPEVSISQPTSKTTATKGRWKTVTILEDKGTPTFYSPRVSMPKYLCEHCGKELKVGGEGTTHYFYCGCGYKRLADFLKDKGTRQVETKTINFLQHQNSKPHEVTIKDLVREIYVSGFRKGFNSKDKNVVVDFSKETSKYVADLLTLISECVGEIENCDIYLGEGIARDNCHMRNSIRRKFNSAIQKRSGV